MRLILYSKPGCHLCEGLQEKLEQIQTLDFDLEIRDITTRDDWFQQFQYEIPVLMIERSQESEDRSGEEDEGRERTGEDGDRAEGSIRVFRLPRLSPRASVQQLEQMLQKFWNDPAQ